MVWDGYSLFVGNGYVLHYVQHSDAEFHAFRKSQFGVRFARLNVLCVLYLVSVMHVLNCSRLHFYATPIALVILVPGQRLHNQSPPTALNALCRTNR